MSDEKHVRKFFLDESGSNGDVVRTGANFGFHNQPIFSLGCLGLADEASFSAMFEELKARHRIKSREVKSKDAWAKPEFYLELLAEIERQELPVQIEVVDKRFFIACNIVNTLILPAIGWEGDHAPQTTSLRNLLAEYITEVLPDSCLTAFAIACENVDGKSILAVYNVLSAALTERPNEPLRDQLKELAADSEADFRRDGPDDPEVVRRYLPVPDYTPNGSLVWMLPNLPCFTNIYARLNTYTGGKLSSITLYQDEQNEFGSILRDSKVAAELLATEGLSIKYGSANYVFHERAELCFIKSIDSVGVQAADVLAGYAMRLVYSKLVAGAKPRHDGDWQLRRLLDQDDDGRGLGTNFVLTGRQLRMIGLL